MSCDVIQIDIDLTTYAELWSNMYRQVPVRNSKKNYTNNQAPDGMEFPPLSFLETKNGHFILLQAGDTKNHHFRF